MEKFTQLNLQASAGGEKPEKKPHPGKKGKIAAIAASATAGLLIGIGLLQTSACSREKDKPVLVNPSAQISPGQPSTPAVTTPATAAPEAKKPVARKRARKTSTIVTYKSPDYGVSFRYPRSYILKTGDEPHLDLAGLGPVVTNFVQPGAVTVAAVELPRGSYPGSEVSSAFFSVSMNPNISEQECSQFAFAVPTGPDEAPVDPVKVQVGALQYDELEDAVKQSDARYYHVFQNGSCWEFGLGMGMIHDSDSQEAFTQVNPADVFSKLEKILASVKIEPAVTPEVAVTPVHPAEETHQAATPAGTQSAPETPNR